MNKERRIIEVDIDKYKNKNEEKHGYLMILKDLKINKFFDKLYHMQSLISRRYWQNKYKEYKKTMDISDSFLFAGERILIFHYDFNLGFNFHGGNNSMLREDTTINFSGGNVYIGDNCRIGRKLSIYTLGTYTEDWCKGIPYERCRSDCYGDVIIGNKVWICNNVSIVAPVKIGDNSVIGACSVVTKDIPSGCVAVGNPCKVVKKYDIHKEKK